MILLQYPQIISVYARVMTVYVHIQTDTCNGHLENIRMRRHKCKMYVLPDKAEIYKRYTVTCMTSFGTNDARARKALGQWMVKVSGSWVYVTQIFYDQNVCVAFYSNSWTYIGYEL